MEGTITLPDGDGTFAATSVIVNSAPGALGYTLPFDVLANLTSVTANTFTVSSGAIVSSSFFAQNSTDALLLNFDNGTLGSLFKVSGSADENSGVQDIDSSTLSYSADSVPFEFSPGLGILILMGLWGGKAAYGKFKSKEIDLDFTSTKEEETVKA